MDLFVGNQCDELRLQFRFTLSERCRNDAQTTMQQEFSDVEHEKQPPPHQTSVE